MRIYVFIIVLLGIILILGTTGILLFSRLMSSAKPEQTASQISTISGKFDINGVIPQGATITIFKKDYGSVVASQSAATNIPAVDEGSWSIGGVSAGKTYELMAQVSVGNQVLINSKVITVTAPAGSEKFILNIPGEAGGNAAISGNVQVNGYIPSGATISVLGKTTAEKTYKTLAGNLAAAQKQLITYDSAISGETYELIGYLYDSSGNQIGSSAPLSVVAPAADELITINSQALAPTSAPQAVSGQTPTPTPVGGGSRISGTIDFNGVAPSNSRIAIFQKVYTASSYQLAVDNVTPTDNATWQWDGAKPSTWYNLIAVLKQHNSNGTDTDIATSTTGSAAAPASNVVLIVNSNIAIPAPGSTPSVLCLSISGNYWNARVTLPAITSAKSYWYQVGTYSGGNNVASKAFNATGTGNQTDIIQLNSGTPYYFRYSYAYVADVAAGSAQYSPFSSVSQANCGN